MEAVTTLPYGRPLTRDDLDTMPDDGHRYELIDGALIVTPAPVWMHQRISANLLTILRSGCPAELEVLHAPFEVTIADDTVLQPDVLVARRSDYQRRGLRGAPVLAVEILSPSTRRIDLMLKRSRLESAGCPSYWTVDPDTASLVAWDLRDGSYAEVGNVSGSETFRAVEPFDVGVVPADLLR